MKYAYALLGIGCLVLIAVLFMSNTQSVVQPEKETPMDTSSQTFTLSSSAFKEGESIPVKYTCDGDKFMSPPLSISNVPEGTKSFVLTMEDPDVPKEYVPSGVFDHWVLYSVPPETREIPEGAQGVGNPGVNGVDDLSYTGPCPPNGSHRYIFTLYALSGTLNFIKAPTKDNVVQAAQNMTLEKAVLTARYERPQ